MLGMMRGAGGWLVCAALLVVLGLGSSCRTSIIVEARWIGSFIDTLEVNVDNVGAVEEISISHPEGDLLADRTSFGLNLLEPRDGSTEVCVKGFRGPIPRVRGCATGEVRLHSALRLDVFLESCGNAEDVSMCNCNVVCDPEESSSVCSDCFCGDGICDAAEDCACPEDCGSSVNDGMCNCGEMCSPTTPDCSPCCGDDVCDPGENFAGCPLDCSALTVNVVGFQTWSDLETPLSGVTVAVDMATGERIELVSDAMGHAIFDRIDWAAGPISVTGHLDGYILRSLVGFSERAEVNLFLQERPGPAPTLVAVSGAALNMVDEGHTLLVSATPGGSTATQAVGPSWSLIVPADTPFTLVGLEFYSGAPNPPHGVDQEFVKWTILDHVGVSVATNVDLDFGSPAHANLVNGSFNRPSRPDSPLRGDYTWGYVRVRAGEAAVGFSTYLAVADHGDVFEYEVEWIEPAGIGGVKTRYEIMDSSWNVLSVAIVEGYPTAGVLAPGILDVPRLVWPPPPPMSSPLHGTTVECEVFDTGIVVGLVLAAGGTLWEVYADIDVSSLTVPLPPSSVDVDTVLGLGPLWGQLQVTDPGVLSASASRIAYGDTILLVH